jgi:hypothetical protein
MIVLRLDTVRASDIAGLERRWFEQTRAPDMGCSAVQPWLHTLTSRGDIAL